MGHSSLGIKIAPTIEEGIRCDIHDAHQQWAIIECNGLSRGVKFNRWLVTLMKQLYRCEQQDTITYFYTPTYLVDISINTCGASFVFGVAYDPVQLQCLWSCTANMRCGI